MKREERIKYAEMNGALLDEYRTDIDAKAKEIDPIDEADWWSLTMGWALGRGLGPEGARTFADFVRYHTPMG